MKKWSGINFYVQLVILVVGLLSVPFLTVFALLFTMPFGLWQVISSIVFGVRFRFLEPRFRIYLNIYWIVLVIAIIAIFLSTNSSYYPREMHDYMIGCSITICSLLGVSFFIFSILVRNNEIKIENSFSSDILDQM